MCTIAGPESSRDPQKGGVHNELVVFPSIQPKGLYVFLSICTVLIVFCTDIFEFSHISLTHVPNI